MMSGSRLTVLLATLLLISLVPATAATGSSDDLSRSDRHTCKRTKGFLIGNDEARSFEVKGSVINGKLGSEPPSCERKCRGCIPCSAIQVPTVTGRIRPQVANYEPEGWKCKCGSVFFNP